MTATYLGKTMLFFASGLTPLVRLATTRSCAEGDTRRKANNSPLISQYRSHSVFSNVRDRYEKHITLGNTDVWIRLMSWASYWWSRDSRDLWLRRGWSKGGTTIIRARDEKRRIGNKVMSARMSKNVNTNLILKSFAKKVWKVKLELKR